jgi:hypothetical protein
MYGIRVRGRHSEGLGQGEDGREIVGMGERRGGCRGEGRDGIACEKRVGRKRYAGGA